MERLVSQIKRFSADESGIFGVIFAVLAVVLVAMSGAVVDFVSVEQARTRSQVALDAAALALQQQLYETPQPSAASLQAQAQLLLNQQVNDPTITATVTSVTPDFKTSTIDIRATIDVPTNFVRLVGVNHLQASLLSEATRGSVNLEVALALDITGSMGEKTASEDDDPTRAKISDLIDATNELIDLVVKDEQEPAYTKMAFAPYSVAVNVGAYADQVRGPVEPGQKISNAVWKGTRTKNISGATSARPVVITSNSHGFANGDWVTISGVNGLDDINGRAFEVRNKSKNTFELYDTSGNPTDERWSGSYWSGGTITACKFARCEVQVTVNGNTFANGDHVHITGINGLSGLNNQTFTVGSRTASAFVLGGSTGSGNYSSGGTAWCTLPGCQYYYFKTRGWGTNYETYEITNCVSERTDHADDDTKPSVAPLGRVYTRYGSCLEPDDKGHKREIVPLTTDKTKLHNVADGLGAEGNTAGHIGLAWAWYLVSPEFAYLWPNDSKPAAYDAPHVQKVVVLMTDGAFNTAYCNGVVYGTIDCDPPDKDSFEQAQAICDKMKESKNGAPPVIVYTVGFDIGSNQSAQNIMANCATDAEHAYLADTGTELSAAFQAIGRNITALRVSR